MTTLWMVREEVRLRPKLLLEREYFPAFTDTSMALSFLDHVTEWVGSDVALQIKVALAPCNTLALCGDSMISGAAM